jgi:hypothetical protein
MKNSVQLLLVRMVLVRLRTEKFVEIGLKEGREIINASNGLITWSEAGDGWCRLVMATPGVDYPSL